MTTFIDEDACRRNFEKSSDYILAEPIYIALQMAGYTGDAHEVVNRRLLPLAKERNISLIRALEHEAVHDDIESQEAFNKIPSSVRIALSAPENYIGIAIQKSFEIAEHCREVIEFK